MQVNPKHPTTPTLWGLGPLELHDRFWASCGVQVVRQQDHRPLVDTVELYLLLGSAALVIFRIRQLIDALSWLQPQLMLVRIQDHRQTGFGERIVTDAAGDFQRLERLYHASGLRWERAALTADPQIAQAWRATRLATQGWSRLRELTPRAGRCARRVAGSVFDRHQTTELNAFTRCLVEMWDRPASTIPVARRVQREVWTAASARVDRGARFIGPAWIGEGRRLEAADTIVGPAVLWDAPDAKPAPSEVPWDQIEPTDTAARPPRAVKPPARPVKRLFDIVFALIALTLTLPLYPLIMLAIIIEDGWPVFFTHRRETLADRTFPCIKFRSMRRDAEAIKAQLARQNKADGPQFYLEHDPRLTRIGRFLRRTNLDELPQFINVLLGHMSVVGPRPSPYNENQYCPAWREARLSTRPGITGLWQVMRSRQSGLDFQEWIRFDIAYVERMSLRLDLWIIWKTLGVVLKGIRKR